MTKLLGSIYHGRDDIMASAVEHGRVPPHQSYRYSAEQLACWLSLVTALLSGQGLPKSPHHIRCHTSLSLSLCIFVFAFVFVFERQWCRRVISGQLPICCCSPTARQAPCVSETAQLMIAHFLYHLFLHIFTFFSNSLHCKHMLMIKRHYVPIAIW